MLSVDVRDVATVEQTEFRQETRSQSMKPYGCIIILLVNELLDDLALCVRQRSNEYGTGRYAKIPYGAVAWCRRPDLDDVLA